MLGSSGPALRATDLQEVKTLSECPLLGTTLDATAYPAEDYEN